MREELKSKILFLTKFELILLISAVAYNFTGYCGGRFLAKGHVHYDFSLPIDSVIPFVPATVLIYWGCYLFWAANYIISVKIGHEEAKRFILAHFIGETVCFVAFIFLPTTMERATLSGDSLIMDIMRLTYTVDSSDNLLPSIHCFVSWLCFIGVRGKKSVPKWYQFASLIMALSVCVSTLTVKQHIIVDVFAGVLLAEISFLLAKPLLKKLNQLFSKNGDVKS